MTHKRPVTPVRLYDSRRFQIVLVESVHHLVQSSDVVIVSGKIDIASFFPITIRVQSICFTIFIVGEKSKVLRPVPERRGRVDEAVGAGDVVGCCEPL